MGASNESKQCVCIVEQISAPKPWGGGCGSGGGKGGGSGGGGGDCGGGGGCGGFVAQDLKELSNEQQRIVIRTQMDGNEFFDHLLALGELRRGMEAAYLHIKESSRSLLESLYMKPPTAAQLAAVTPPAAAPVTMLVDGQQEGAPDAAEAPVPLDPELHWDVLEELLKIAIIEAFEWGEMANSKDDDVNEADDEPVQQKNTDEMLKTFTIEALATGGGGGGGGAEAEELQPLHARLSAVSGKTVYLLVYRLLGVRDQDAPPEAVEIEFEDGMTASLRLTHLLNRCIHHLALSKCPSVTMDVPDLLDDFPRYRHRPFARVHPSRFIDLDPAHFRYALATMELVCGATTLEVKIEIHVADVLKANLASVKTSGESGADHYNYFKTQLVGKVPPITSGRVFRAWPPRRIHGGSDASPRSSARLVLFTFGFTFGPLHI